MLRALALLLTCVYAVSAQQRVPQEMMYHHVWAIVPLIGSGTADDPRRPMFAPAPPDFRARAQAVQSVAATKQDVAPPAVISYTMQLSDDKKSALVEFVGIDAKSLEFITQSKDPNVKAFEQGKATQQQIETEMKKVKANFTLDGLKGKVAQTAQGAAK